MPPSSEQASAEAELLSLRAEVAQLRERLGALGIDSSTNGQPHSTAPLDQFAAAAHATWDGTHHGLSKEQVARYSRQIVLGSFGVHAQARLCRGSVLVVGAGGLGSPAALYLAAAGVGRLGIADRDTVDLSNLHRQVIHREAGVGAHKARSAAAACAALNSGVAVEAHLEGLTPGNAVEVVSRYDVVVDASDNAPTRYLVSDACVVAGKPLVSGASIGLDGQLTVYCHGEDGPCYRCLFPAAPRPESCARCVDAGVLGVVPGVVGTLQALEAVKLLSGVGEPLSRRLLLVDALAARFHSVKLRARSPECVACGSAPSITAASLPSYDYAAFTGQAAANDGPPAPLRLLSPEQRLTPEELRDRLESGGSCVLVDVRPAEQFAICHLPGAVHAPWAKFDSHVDAIKQRLLDALPPATPGEDEGPAAAAAGGSGEAGATPSLIVVCRRGNDSQRAVARLRELGLGQARDVAGGMEAWAACIDPTFPVY